VDAPDIGVAVERIRAAFARRDALGDRLNTDALRMFDSVGDGLDRLVIERYADAWRVSGGPDEAVHLPAVRAVVGDSNLFWRFGGDAAGTGGPLGDAGRREVFEGPLRFGVELVPNRNTGLFLDARPARAWVRTHSEGRRVLNLFAYTGAFGVAAAAGGARSTVNVDPVPGALARAEGNYRRNGLACDGRTFWRSDALEAIKRAGRSGARFDGVVLDPPPVPTGGRRGARTDVAVDLERLVRAAVGVLAPGGWLLLLVAHRGVDAETVAAAAGLGASIWTGSSDADFVPAPGSPGLRALAFTAP
jgi:23S rRNA G2069 N7-methylase RlmK/C1962 C5-methylase RlmI